MKATLWKGLAVGICVLIAFGLGAAHAVAPEEGMEPVNVVNESGKEVGLCLDKAALSYPPQAYKGLPYFLRTSDPAFRAAHDALTKKEEKWLKEMSGPASQNRLYVDRSGNRILVTAFCKQGDCGNYSAYGAFDMATNTYGIEVTEMLKRRTLGKIPEVSRAAMTCAAMFDQKLREETEAKAFGRKPGGKQ